jgi:hypothetical protein
MHREFLTMDDFTFWRQWAVGGSWRQFGIPDCPRRRRAWSVGRWRSVAIAEPRSSAPPLPQLACFRARMVNLRGEGVPNASTRMVIFSFVDVFVKNGRVAPKIA